MAYEQIPLQQNTQSHRFEMMIDGKAAFINYQQKDNKVYLIHTEVDELLEGQGVAAALVEKTLRHLDEHGLVLVPRCSYVQHYLQRHPHWNKLLANAPE